MAKKSHYFTFPLSILNAHRLEPSHGFIALSPLQRLRIALDCGVVNAGIGYTKCHSREAFEDFLDETWSLKGKGRQKCPLPDSPEAIVLVGEAVTNSNLGDFCPRNFRSRYENGIEHQDDGPLVRMKADFVWAALGKARAEELENQPFPKKAISWNEFRVLCAIFSAKINRQGYALLGWETIQARACGFSSKAKFIKAKESGNLHGLPLSRKQIRTILEKLENLNFFARFRYSSGARGGYTAYSVRHSRQELGRAVCEWANFKNRTKVKANREEDLAVCQALLKKTKVGPSTVQVRGQHNEKCVNEGSKREKLAPHPPKGAVPGQLIFPQGYQDLSERAQMKVKVLANSALMIEVGKIMNRPPDTLWTVAEAIAFQEVSPTSDEIVLVRDYYRRASGWDFERRRRSILRLLNNWSSELDRARCF